MSKTITRLFDNYSDASNAVSQLEQLGVRHDDISLVANNADKTHDHHPARDRDVRDEAGKGAIAGTVLGGAGGLLAGLGLLAIPGLGPVVAAGWLISAAVGAGVGAAAVGAAGGLAGALMNAGESEEDAHVYSEGVRRGGSLVSAKVDDDMATQAEAVFDRNKSVNAADRGQAYRATGWTTFDESASAYTPDQVAGERSLYAYTDARV